MTRRLPSDVIFIRDTLISVNKAASKDGCHSLPMKNLFLAIFLSSTVFVFAAAGQTAIWTVNTRADVLKGDARSVSIDENGTISIAPTFAEIYKTEQPYIWSAAVDPSGNIFLGTGGEGRIYRVSAGKGALFADLAELNVSALAIGRSGELFAATSPDGKVYRLDAAGKPEVYFDPKEKYIWSMAMMPDGSLAVGTGEGGKIFRVRSANATPEASLMFDTSEAHIISLAADSTGNLYAGTDSSGLVLRFGSDGKPFALLDSPLREIHEIAIGQDGSIYALALGESASAATPSASPKPPEAASGKTVKVDKPAAPAPPAAVKSKYDLTGARSAVYRLTNDGGPEILWSSPTVSGFSIYPHRSGNGVLLGTSDKGRIYNISNDGRETLVLQSDANHISTIFGTPTELFAASSNQGTLFKIGASVQSTGNYESAVLDSEATSIWGSLWWRSAGNVRIETRSGNTEEPNETWSAWQPVLSESSRGPIQSPRARYIQWRATLQAGTAAALNELSLAFTGLNIGPEVLSITILPANIGLLANPAPQIDPNIELSGLDPIQFGVPVQVIQPRRVYQRGARAIQWTAEDRNGDTLVYDVYFKEVRDAEFKLLRENISETFVSLDGLSLADGRYLVKVVAKDSPSNPAGSFGTGERISEPFDIDNTQPTVRLIGQPQVSAGRARINFSASDPSSYITRAEYSVNGGDWIAVVSDDGISDSPEERYTVDASLPAAGEYVITLRVFDSSGNVGNARAVVRR
jgi:hypothetical protein